MTGFRGSFAQGTALWRAGGFGELPPALTRRQHGQTVDPQVATDAAERELRAQGTITHLGPNDDLRGLLTIFTRAEVEVDLTFTPSNEHEVRVLVAVHGADAGRWVIHGDTIAIDAVPATTAFSSLLEPLPDIPPVLGHSVTLRTEDLQDAAIEAEEHPDKPEHAAMHALLRADVAPADAETVVRMLTGHPTLNGQLGAATYTPRERTRVRGRRTIEVIDKPDGRVTRHQLGVHTTIAPGDQSSTTQALARLVEDTLAETPDD